MTDPPDLPARWHSADVSGRRDRLQHGFELHAGCLAGAIEALEQTAARAATGLWQRDATLWSQDPAVQDTIANRLGWLDSPALMAASLGRLKTFADEIRSEGFTDAVLLGMGGSSLAPDVLRSVVGTVPGWLHLHMLDSTDPAAILGIDTPLARTLYVVASKSGTTIESNSLAAFFRQGLQHAEILPWSKHFVAITDAGTELEARARRDKFREVFINPSDIGGRYSALSFFGLVPAALMGQDIEAVVGWGADMLAASEAAAGPASARSAIALAMAMAAGAQTGRDKLTLIVPPGLEAFGRWAEQLVAESTGKRGIGVIPIAGEAPLAADRYSRDRVFVHLALAGAPDAHNEALVSALQTLEAPVVTMTMAEPAAIGAEFARWEVATALAGALLGVNPFDEPNVAQAKSATHKLLGRFKLEGQMPVARLDQATSEGVGLTLSTAAREALGSGPDRFLTLIAEHDYFALLAYVGPNPELAAALRELRTAVRERTGAATMFGYGPRYLHSTGQLHKGGPNTGVFVVVSAVPRVDFPIPGESFSFGTLELAQAIGDFESLDAAGRRALHVALPEPDPGILKAVADLLLGQLAGRIPSQHVGSA